MILTAAGWMDPLFREPEPPPPPTPRRRQVNPKVMFLHVRGVHRGTEVVKIGGAGTHQRCRTAAGRRLRSPAIPRVTGVWVAPRPNDEVVALMDKLRS